VMPRLRWKDKNGTPFDVGSRVTYHPDYKVEGIITGCWVCDDKPRPFIQTAAGAFFPIVPELTTVHTGGE